jgi:hypothetical protein
METLLPRLWTHEPLLALAVGRDANISLLSRLLLSTAPDPKSWSGWLAVTYRAGHRDNRNWSAWCMAMCGTSSGRVQWGSGVQSTVGSTLSLSNGVHNSCMLQE